MPLREDLVEPGRTTAGDPIICCVHCHQFADYTMTENAGRVTYELMCPEPQTGSGEITLGAWPNEQQRETDIRNFLDRATRR
jgi:hypothetical protein